MELASLRHVWKVLQRLKGDPWCKTFLLVVSDIASSMIGRSHGASAQLEEITLSIFFFNLVYCPTARRSYITYHKRHSEEVFWKTISTLYVVRTISDPFESMDGLYVSTNVLDLLSELTSCHYLVVYTS